MTEMINSLINELEIYNLDVLVSCNEAARLLGKSNKTISIMIKDGRLTKTTIGGSTGIRLSEIQDKYFAEMRSKNRKSSHN